jgi:Flp pilus assembly pilin Flp
MSVEYALLLVVITGAVAGVLGLGVTDWFKQAGCAMQAATNGNSCDGGLPAPTGPPAGPGPTGGPATQPPSGIPALPCDSTSSTSSTSGASAAESQAETSGSNPSASDCSAASSSTH